MVNDPISFFFGSWKPAAYGLTGLTNALSSDGVPAKSALTFRQISALSIWLGENR